MEAGAYCLSRVKSLISTPYWAYLSPTEVFFFPPSFVRLSKRSCRSLKPRQGLCWWWNLTARVGFRQASIRSILRTVYTSSSALARPDVGKEELPLIEDGLFEVQLSSVGTIPHFATFSATDSKIVFNLRNSVRWLCQLTPNPAAKVQLESSHMVAVCQLEYVPTLQGFSRSCCNAREQGLGSKTESLEEKAR